jgi:two-component system sensor kinase FixL
MGTEQKLESVTLKYENVVEGESSPNSESLACRLTKLGGCTCCSKEFACLYLSTTTTTSSTSTDYLKSSCLRDAVDAAFDPMFILSETGVIEMANQAAVVMFGYAYQELVGNNVSLVCGGEHGQQHDQYMQNYLQTGTAKVIGKQRVVQARRRDGSEFPVELGVKEFWQAGHRYFCGFMKDLSAQIKHEEELQEREHLLQSIIDSSFEPMFEIDEEGLILVVNAAATHMFGWTRDEFIGNNISMICGGDHGPKHDQYLRHYLNTGQKRVIGRKRQVQARRKDGSEFEIELGIQEVFLSAGRRAFCGYVRDLTQQKLDKRALRKNAQIIHGKFFGKSEEESL